MEDAWENRIGNRVTRTVLGETKDVITLIVQHPADVNLLISTQNQIGKSNFSSRVVQKCLFSVWLFFLICVDAGKNRELLFSFDSDDEVLGHKKENSWELCAKSLNV